MIRPDNVNIRLIGHWDKSDLSEQAATVNSGARILCSFTGGSIHALFRTTGITSPAQIYASVDGGPPALYKIDSEVIDLAPAPVKGPRHTVEIDIKDVDQRVNRWVPPLQSALVFRGLMLDRGAKTLPSPPAEQLKMEFYGDSITQGIRILSMAAGPDGSDGTRSYAFLTARSLGAVHNQIGFGAQGIFRDGLGNVPPAPQAFGWNYQGSRADFKFIPNVVVINHGTNDQGYPSERFWPAYRDYVLKIRKAYPKAIIFCMRPFGGFHAADIRSAVESLADPSVVYVDTTGWLGPADYTDGVHPNQEGNVKAAKKLVQVISSRMKFKDAA
jgi:lysophospholipase L1-like esterase